MKEITLPKELLNLPQPWGITQPMRRREAIRSLSYETSSIKTGLNVLERCLHTLSQLRYNENNCIPEEMITYWDFSVQWFAESMPTFDDFNLVKIKQILICDEGIDSPSLELILDVAEYWVWWVTWDLEEATLYWVQRALMKNRDPILISRFLLIAERYWQKIEPRFAESLLSRSAMIGWQKALPLFESVEQNPKVSEDIMETIRDYRDLISDNPHKWLPESDAFSEFLTNESAHLPQTTTQPTLAELAYV